MDAEKLISIPEAARLLGVSRTTLARAAKDKELKAYRIGGSYAVELSEARRWKEENYKPQMKRK